MNEEELNKEICKQNDAIHKDKEIIKHHEARKQRLLAMNSTKKRKEETKHLILIGKAFYGFLGRDYLEGDEDAFLTFLNLNKDEFLKAMSQKMDDSEPERDETSDINDTTDSGRADNGDISYDPFDDVESLNKTEEASSENKEQAGEAVISDHQILEMYLERYDLLCDNNRLNNEFHDLISSCIHNICILLGQIKNDIEDARKYAENIDHIIDGSDDNRTEETNIEDDSLQ